MTPLPSTTLPRVLPLQGASNFRDLGGYPGLGGRAVRWRRLFRSDHLAGLTAADHATLAALGVTRSFDFRGEAERAATPYAIAGLVHHPLTIEPSVTQHMQDLVAAGHALSADTVAGLMRDLYRSLVNDRAERFAELFSHLLQSDAPVIFHCTAGKDRTGVAAALVLRALGVPQAVVLEDYMMTNAVYRHPALPAGETPPEVLAVLWSVHEGFLQAAMEAIDSDHGGIERYLSQRLHLGPSARAALAARYLEGG